MPVACCAAAGYRDAQSERVRRYLRMLGETLPEGCARCCEAIRDLDLRVARSVPAE